MSDIERVTQAVFGDTLIRTGYSEKHQAAYAVAADLRRAMDFKSSAAMFVKGLEKSQVEGKGSNNGAPLYVGEEVIQTPGGRQLMKVVYKRGVFQLLMLSRLPAATQYRDYLFDVMESIERNGGYLDEARLIGNPKDLAYWRARLDGIALRKEFGEVLQEIHEMSDTSGTLGNWIANFTKLVTRSALGISLDEFNRRKSQTGNFRDSCTADELIRITAAENIVISRYRLHGTDGIKALYRESKGLLPEIPVKAA